MAKATLPTNYRDDILNASTEGKRKYRMNYNDDGTVSFVDVTPYDQEGSDFGAGDINATNEAVNQSFDKSKLIRDMDAINALTQEGFAPDALALKDVSDSLESLNYVRPMDWTNLIEEVTFTNTTKTYTVPEDCYVQITLVVTANTEARVTINDNRVARVYFNANATGGNAFSFSPVFFKKGTVLTCYSNCTAASTIKVYGLL